MTVRAAIYSRVSTEGQDTEDKTSLSEQVASCEAWAASRGLEVVGYYQDVASGVRRDRPEWLRMLADVRAGRLTHIIAWSSDRLARTGSAMGDLLDAVQKHKVAVETVTARFDLTYAELMASIARLERNHIMERTLQGKKGTARAGRLPFGKTVYGYRRGDDGLPVVVDVEAVVVRAMFDMYTHDGQGVPTIAKHLRERWGFDRTLGGLYLMLRNSAYAGRMVYDGIEIPCPSIIDPVTWERTQERLTKRRKSGRQTASEFYLMQSLMRCEGCGRTMSCRTRREHRDGRKSKVLRYYQCRGYAPSCRPRPYVRADDLEGRVWGRSPRRATASRPLDGQVQRHPGR